MNPFEKTEGVASLKAGATNERELCNMISDFKLFGDFNGEHIQQLGRFLQGYHFESGVTVFSQGDPGIFMCLIADGQVEIVGKQEDGKSHRLVLLSKGKTVGEMSIVDDEMRSASCITTKPSTLLILTKENFNALITKHPILAVNIVIKLARHLSHRLRGVSGQLVDVMAQ